MGKDGDPSGMKPGDLEAARPSSRLDSGDPRMQVARVLLPDGTHKEFALNRTSDGEALFRLVTADLSIEEREYFSLCFYEKTEGGRHWLYNDKKIAKQLKGLPWEFSFEVKFYPTTPTTLNDDHARYYVFLQLRRDILSGRLAASVATHAILGSYVAQAEFGDSPQTINEQYENFLRTARIVPDPNPEVLTKVVEFHKELRGRTASEVENLYLDTCKQLSLYGIHLFPAKDKNDDDVRVGVGSAGIYCLKSNSRESRFGWQNIVKISYRRSYFLVKLKPGEVDKNEAVVSYRLSDYLHAKRVWKCAVEHHTFFRLIQPEDKPKQSFFNFGSTRFRYHGRTQFQTKMASQMFDKPSTVERIQSSRASHSLENVARQPLTPLHYTDSELEQNKMASPAMSYNIDSRSPSKKQHDEKVGPPFLSPSYVVAADELSFTPESPCSAGAAYYLSERSSLRSPSSAYYSPTTPLSSGPVSPYDYSPHLASENSVQMRTKTKTGAHRNLFGRQSATSTETVRLVSFHEPVDDTIPMSVTYPANELPNIPINNIVHVYHDGRYQRLNTRQQRPPYLPPATSRNGVAVINNLQLLDEMEEQPLRYFVDVKHSGRTEMKSNRRQLHAGKEDIRENLNPRDYVFSDNQGSVLQRTECSKEIQPSHIMQYSSVYHTGHSYPSSSTEDNSVRLLTRVDPNLVVNNDNRGRARVSTSNVNASITSTQHTMSTTVRRQSPDAARTITLEAKISEVSENVELKKQKEKTAVLQQKHSQLKEDLEKSSLESKKKAVIHVKKEPPTEVEKHEVRLIARVAPDQQQEPEPSTSKQEKPAKLSNFFKRGQKSREVEYYPATSESYSGPIVSVERGEELQNIPLDTSTPTYASYSPKKTPSEAPVVVEQRRYRLIARLRHEGDEDEVDKNSIQPEAYGFASTAFEGDVDEMVPEKELESNPLRQHASVYHHGQSWVKDQVSTEVPKPDEVERKKKAVIHVKKEPPTQVEKHEVRLIARIAPDQQQEPEPSTSKQEKPAKLSNFFKRGQKSREVEYYPATSEFYSGPIVSVERGEELQNIPLDTSTPTYASYSPKKTPSEAPVVVEQRRYRLIARLRHEGDEDEVDKNSIQPEAYGFASTAFEGDVDEMVPEKELESNPLRQHASVYHHGQSWVKDQVSTEVPKPDEVERKKKAVIHVKKEPPTQVEKHEVRLIARIAPDQQQEPEPSTNKQEKPAKLSNFFKRGQKSREVEYYPATSEFYSGPIVSVERGEELQNIPLDTSTPTYASYSPKKTPSEAPVVVEQRRYRLIARLRHEGDEDEVDKNSIRPEAYGFASTAFEGDVDEMVPEKELESNPLRQHASVYHHGQSWVKDQVSTEVPKPDEVERKKKAVIHVKKEPPTEVECHEVRLIARVAPDQQQEPEPSTSKQEKPAKLSNFFKRGQKSREVEYYPATSESYSGPIVSVERGEELQNIPLDTSTPSYASYSPKKTPSEAPVVVEQRRYRLIARLRHEGDEDEVDKNSIQPEAYGFASTAFEGDVDDMVPEKELESNPLRQHASVYHHGQSWVKDQVSTEVPKPDEVEKKKKAVIHVKKEPPTEVEKHEVRLIARVAPDQQQEPEPSTSKQEKPAKLSNFFKRGQKSREVEYCPATSESYSGPIVSVERGEELQNIPLDTSTPSYASYSPKKTPSEAPVVVEQRRYRLIARLRHEGDEDEVDKNSIRPEAYGFASTAFEGDVDEMVPEKELESNPLRQHASVYHHGQSWVKDQVSTEVPKPDEVERKKKAVIHVKKEPPTEVEKHEVRLIARVAPDQQQEPEPSTSKQEKPAKLSNFFKRGQKSREVEYCPATSESYSGPIVSVERGEELQNIPLDTSTPTYASYSPKKTPSEAPVVVEQRRYRLIARLRHEGDEDEVDKNSIRPEAYGFASTAFEGDVDEMVPEKELESNPLRQHASVYHHGQSWVKDQVSTEVPKPDEVERKKKAVIHVKKEPPTEVEKHEVRLIARVAPDQQQEPEPSTSKQEKPAKLSNFFKRGPKSREVEYYPATSETYTGPIVSVERGEELQNIPLDTSTPTYASYSPKKTPSEAPVVVEQRRYRLIARLRHEGDEDEVDKNSIQPEAYGFASTAFEGDVDEMVPEKELESNPLRQHASVYHHGQSWVKDQVSTEVPKPDEVERKKKAVIHVKKEPPTEVEKHEVRLIARIAPDQQQEPEPSTSKQEKPAKLSNFFKRGQKSREVEYYPATSETYTGPIVSVERGEELQNIPLDTSTPSYASYSPKKTPSEAPVVVEQRRYRLIARLRHEGDEDEVDKNSIQPEAYGFASTAFEGDVDEMVPEKELELNPLRQHASVYHHGQSWVKDQVSTEVPKPDEVERKKKAVIHVKKEPPTEVEKHEVRLIARIAPDQQQEPEPSTSKQEKPAKLSNFFKRGQKSREVEYYPATSESYSGPIVSVERGEELQNIPLDTSTPTYASYSPKKTPSEAPVVVEQRRYRLIARLRHEGDEDEVDKNSIQPEAYGFASTAFEGDVDEMVPEKELESNPLRQHASVYHHGQSWVKDQVSTEVPKPDEVERKKKAVIHVKKEPPTEVEKHEVRLIARVAPDQQQEPEPSTSKQEKPAKLSNFFKRGPKSREVEYYPATSETYTGPIVSVERGEELQNIPLDTSTPSYASYSPKKTPSEAPVVVEQRRYRLIARLRHEGDEDEVDKNSIQPEAYGFASTAFEGDVDEMVPEKELESNPLRQHASVYHHGQSWVKDQVSTEVPKPDEVERKKKAVIHVKKEPPTEVEKHEVRLIARIAPDQQQEPEPSTSKQEKPAKLSNFFKRGQKSREVEYYPATSESNSGPIVSVERGEELQNIPLDTSTPSYASYSPKKTPSKAPVVVEQRRSRLIARLRHEGDEDEVDRNSIQPEAYGFASTAFEGDVDEMVPEKELESNPLRQHASVYHHGQSWVKDQVSTEVPKPDEVERKKKAVIHVKKEPPTEVEKHEVHLIARIAPDQQQKPEPSTSKQEKPAKLSNFFKRGPKSREVEYYPATSETYTGPIVSVERNEELQNIPLDTSTPSYASYSPKKTPSEAPVVVEQRRYRLIARLRHEGDEDEVDKNSIQPEAYGFASTAFEGDVDEMVPEKELESNPLRQHASVYHHGQSWVKDQVSTEVPKPDEVERKKKAVIHVKKEPPTEVEKHEVRLIARIAPDQQQEPEPSTSKQEKSAKLSNFFRRGQKSREVEYYPATSESYSGPIVSVERGEELQNIPLDTSTPSYASYSPKKTPSESPVVVEQRRYRLIARLRHEGDEDEVDKNSIQPEAYGFASTAFEGDVDEMVPEKELELNPLRQHASVYHHGQSWVKDQVSTEVSKPDEVERKKKAVIHVKKEPPTEVEKHEVRLIARIAPDQQQEPEPSTSKQEKPAKLSNFFKRGQKSREVEYCPATSESYSGPIVSVERGEELQNIPLDTSTPSYASYSPKKTPSEAPVVVEQRRYRLIARLRHEGDEDEVDKNSIQPEAYGFASTAFEGDVDEMVPEKELESNPLRQHASVYHHGQSWVKDQVSTEVPKPDEVERKKKAVIHVKKEPPTEVEKHEVRLIARIAPDQQQKPEPSTSKQEKPAKLSNFFKRGQKSREVEYYPATSESNSGPIVSVERGDELQNIPLDTSTPSYASYSPKKTPSKAPVVVEQRRYRLIARLRHEGDEDEVDRNSIQPEAYGFASTAFEGDVDEMVPEKELESNPLRQHASVYHHGQSWVKDQVSTEVPKPDEVERKKKAVIHVKKEPPTEVEKHEVRLIARIAPDQQQKPEPSTSKQEKPAKLSNFFKRGPKSREVEYYPATSETYTGPIVSVERNEELQNIPLDTSTPTYASYSPKKTPSEAPVVVEQRRYRLIARLRHEGDEDEVDKNSIQPEAYGFASTAFEGDVDEMVPEKELELNPLRQHASVYHHGQSWVKDQVSTEVSKPDEVERKKKAVIHVKKEPPTEVEKHEVRLIARIAPDQQQEPEPSTSKQEKSAKLSNFFKRVQKSREVEYYPATSESYSGPIVSVERGEELQNIPLDTSTPSYASYSPKKTPSESPVVVEQRRYRLIARLRHEGDEDEVDKNSIQPEAYGFASTAFEGDVDEMVPEKELELNPLRQHASVYHHGQSWVKDQVSTEVSKPDEVERKKKAVIHVKKEPPTEVEKHEVRLIARIAPDQQQEPEPSTSKQEKPAKLSSFFKRGQKYREVEYYPATSESYSGPIVSVERGEELQNIPLDTSTPTYASYSPKKTPSEAPVVVEQRRYRLIARLRHEGDEDEVDKNSIQPEAYGFASTAFEGDVDEMVPEKELESNPLRQHASVYHHGQSWVKDQVSTEVPKPDEVERKKKAVIHVKKEPPTEVEKHEVRLIARIAPDQQQEPEPSTSKQEKSAKLSNFFKRGQKSREVEYYPATSESNSGPIVSVERGEELQNIPLDTSTPTYASYSPKKTPSEAPVVVEQRRYRLIARLRHEGDEDEVDKNSIQPEAYGFASTAFEGDVDEMVPEKELESNPLLQHASVYHHGQSWVKDQVSTEVPKPDEVERKKKAVIHVKKEPLTEVEKRELRLIAKVLPQQRDHFSLPSSEGRGESGSDNIKTLKLLQDLEKIAFPSSEKAKAPRATVVTYLPSSLRFEPKAARVEGCTADGNNFVEINLERRVEVQLEPLYCLRGAGIGAVSEDESGLIFTSTPPSMSPPERSFLARLGLKRDKKGKQSRKGKNETNSSESSDSDDEKRRFAVITSEIPKKGKVDDVKPVVFSPTEEQLRMVRQETRETEYRLKGEGLSAGFNPADPSLSTTMAEAERLNASSPRLEHAERTFTVRATAPIPVSFEESGQPHTTVSSWQENSELPEQVVTDYDEHGNKITRTIRTSQVKHTVQKQTFQNYIVDDDQNPVGVVQVERSREQLTPVGQEAKNGYGVAESHTRTMTYDANGGDDAWGGQGLGEFVSSKTVTQGNRTIETITYKVEKDGIIETRVEHRVTIHSDAAIDHDSELSQAILEATQMNPDMTVEKIEVRQETTN
ncbi:unnamed protein product [Caenorhabditis auriculariae]|uniref:FERM domain-containing protein n=1 Tax=Caenorhabditis auriculariae TaxID=2777116 RepID=A0A8S1GMM2_9PELO|nr:unnamed protein product [Caenorhabditis auriculariae]